MTFTNGLPHLLDRFRQRHVVQLAGGLARLAPNRRQAVRNAGCVLGAWFRFRLAVAPRGLHRVTVVASATTLKFFVRDFVDLCVAEEVFIHEHYAIPDAHEPSVILDFGSHIGLSVLWFRARYPAAQIYAFEPDPKSFELLRRNTRALAKVSVQQLAVGGSERVAEFFPSAQSWLSSLVINRTRPDVEPITVNVRSPGQILADLGIARADLVKLDVEGAEWEILESTPLDVIADVVVGELHAHGANEEMPARGLPRLGAFAVDVRHNDSERCVFVAQRFSGPVRSQ